MYAIVDIEGDGAPYRQESITEIAIFRFNGREIIDQFISMVNPEGPITPFVQKLTGITDKMVRTAPKFHELAKRIVEITDDAILVGHNIKFDYRMLRQSFHRLGYDFEKETIDTLPLAKELIPGESSYSLGKLTESIGIPLVDRHRASGDARATVELFKVLLDKDRDKAILQKQKGDAPGKTLSKKVDRLTEFLPAESGIIYFQDKTGKILLNEFCRNIYQTADHVLTSKSNKWRKLTENISQIEYEFTGTELIAKLILLQKERAVPQTLRFGLYAEEDHYEIRRKWPGKVPILKFSTFSQAQKVLSFVNEDERFISDPKALRKFLSLKNHDGLWISGGRSTGENSFLYLENGIVKGFGFYQLNHQIDTLEKIDKRMVKITKTNDKISNELKLSLLRKTYEIKPLPDRKTAEKKDNNR